MSKMSQIFSPAPRDRPQIEVAFEIDSKGLNENAEDKGAGKYEKITLTDAKRDSQN